MNPTLFDAIVSLNPNVVRMIDTTAFDKNGTVVNYDANAAQAKLTELEAAQAKAEQAAKDAKASALAKLTALGLTADEVKALIG